MIVGRNYINGLNKVTGAEQKPKVNSQNNTETNFESILQGKIDQNNEVKFSKHAELRMKARNINLSQEQKDKINTAVAQADAKGVKDSLVLMDGMAFVVSVKNKTVVTAVNEGELRNNVFTNIDGAIVI